VKCVAFTPDGSTVVSGGLDQTVRFWPLSGPQEVVTMSKHLDAVNVIASATGVMRFVTGSADRTAKVWQLGGDGSSLREPYRVAPQQWPRLPGSRIYAN
jgi:WD40 repeat protein